MKNIYIISGIGCNTRVFERLKAPSGYVMKPIEWIEPQKDEDIKDYLRRMCGTIEMDDHDVIMGVSLGGIATQCLYEMYPRVRRIVVISAPVSYDEFSFVLKIFKWVKIYRWIPSFFLSGDFMYSYLVTGSFKSRHRKMIGRFMGHFSVCYFRWAASMALEKRELDVPRGKMIRIHGGKDILFPITRIKTPSYVIEEATHLAIYTHAVDINSILEKELLF